MLNETIIKNKIEEQLSISVAACFWQDDEYLMFEAANGMELAYTIHTKEVMNRDSGETIGIIR